MALKNMVKVKFMLKLVFEDHDKYKFPKVSELLTNIQTKKVIYCGFDFSLAIQR